MIEAGFSESNADEMLNVEFKAFALSNNNANINRYKARLEQMLSVKDKETIETHADGYTVVENTDIIAKNIDWRIRDGIY